MIFIGQDSGVVGVLTARVSAGFAGGSVSADRGWSAAGKDGEPWLTVRTQVRPVLVVAAAGREPREAGSGRAGAAAPGGGRGGSAVPGRRSAATAGWRSWPCRRARRARPGCRGLR